MALNPAVNPATGLVTGGGGSGLGKNDSSEFSETRAVRRFFESSCGGSCRSGGS